MAKNNETKASERGKAWLKKEMRPYRGSIVFLTTLTIFSVLLSLSFSYLIKYLINGAADKNGKIMLVFSAVLLVIILCRAVVGTLNSYLSERCRAKITVGLRSRLFSRLLHADYAKAEKYHSGDMLTRLTTDVGEVASDSVSILPAVVGMISQCVGAIVALLLVDPLFTAVFTCGGLLVGGMSALFRKKMKETHKAQTEADGKSRAFMQEGIASLLTLKAYGAEERSAEKSRQILDDYYKKRMVKNVYRTGMGAAFSLLGNLGTVVAVLWCGFRIMHSQDPDYGAVLSVIMLLNQLQQPFSAFSSVMPVVYARAASAERLSEIDELAEEPCDKNDGVSYDKMQAITLEDLSFTYGRNPVLTGANARLEKGKIVCITGGSGSGKSTLFKLLLCVYRPENGSISIECENGKKPLTAAQRELFAYVPQGNFLFSGTIYENLTFFTAEEKGEKLDERVKRALVSACAEFVFELPEGLSTALQERGGGLSEGQLQRLAIARALLSDAPILLLDEATSALDGETERRVLENIKNAENKTCFIVTHRPAALSIADQVIDVKDGKIEQKVRG